MRKLLLIALLLIVGCTSGPQRKDYQAFIEEDVESPFFYVPPLNQKDYESRTWILLAESQSKMWFYDPYSLSEDEDGVITYDAFIKPREQNDLAPFNATLVGPYRQKIDCYSNNQWSEIFYVDQLPPPAPSIANTKPINGSGWVKIAPRTAMAYIRSRLCGRKFLDEQNTNFFLYQEGFLPMPKAQPDTVVENEFLKSQGKSELKEKEVQTTESQKQAFVYEVINNEVILLDAKKDVRQLKIGSYFLTAYLPKKADYLFTANCQSNSYKLTSQGVGENSSGLIGQTGGQKDSLAAIAFNRACGNHGSYMKLVSQFSK